MVCAPLIVFLWFLRARKKQKAKLFVAENGPFGTPVLTPKIPPKGFMWVPFLRPFPGNEAHKLFWGCPKWGVLGGRQKVFYVEKVFVLFLPPSFSRSFQALESSPQRKILGQDIPRTSGECPGVRGKKLSPHRSDRRIIKFLRGRP